MVPECEICGKPILIAINQNDGVCSENCRKAQAEMKKVTGGPLIPPVNMTVFDYRWGDSGIKRQEIPPVGTGPKEELKVFSLEKEPFVEQFGDFSTKPPTDYGVDKSSVKEQLYSCELCGYLFPESKLAMTSEEGLRICDDCFAQSNKAVFAEGKQPPVDLVNHPPHYKTHPYGLECIEVTEHMNFNTGNAVKYIWRAGEKGDVIQDLEKALWYLKREIERRKKTHDQTPTFVAKPEVYDFDDNEDLDECLEYCYKDAAVTINLFDAE